MTTGKEGSATRSIFRDFSFINAISHVSQTLEHTLIKDAAFLLRYVAQSTYREKSLKEKNIKPVNRPNRMLSIRQGGYICLQHPWTESWRRRCKRIKMGKWLRWAIIKGKLFEGRAIYRFNSKARHVQGNTMHQKIKRKFLSKKKVQIGWLAACRTKLY